MPPATSPRSATTRPASPHRASPARWSFRQRHHSHVRRRFAGHHRLWAWGRRRGLDRQYHDDGRRLRRHQRREHQRHGRPSSTAGDISATGVGSAGIYAAGYTGTGVMNFGTIIGCPCGGGVMQALCGDNNLVNFGSIIAAGRQRDRDGHGAEPTSSRTSERSPATCSWPAGPASFNNQRRRAVQFRATSSSASSPMTVRLAPGGRGTIETTALGDRLRRRPAPASLPSTSTGGDSRPDQRYRYRRARRQGRRQPAHAFPRIATQSFTILQADERHDRQRARRCSPARRCTRRSPTPMRYDVVLGIEVDFYVDDLNPNQRAIAYNLDQVFHAGVGGLGPVILGLLNTAATTSTKPHSTSSCPSSTPTPRSLRFTRASASRAACSSARSTAPTRLRSFVRANACGLAPTHASCDQTRPSTRSATGTPPACSPPAHRWRSTMCGGLVLPAAISRALWSPRLMRRATARSHKAASLSSIIRARCWSPAR